MLAPKNVLCLAAAGHGRNLTPETVQRVISTHVRTKRAVQQQVTVK